VLQRSPTSVLSTFVSVTVTDILSVLSTSTSFCTLDPIPTFLVRRMAVYFAPIICNLCNLSLTIGVCPLLLNVLMSLLASKSPLLIRVFLLPIIQSPTCASCQRSSSRLSLNSSGLVFQRLICYPLISLPIVHFTLRKLLFFAFIMIWSLQSIMLKFKLSSFLHLHLTPSIMQCFYLYALKTLNWLHSYLSDRSPSKLLVTRPSVFQRTALSSRGRRWDHWNLLSTRKGVGSTIGN
jgi:hypothetical protein